MAGEQVAGEQVVDVPQGAVEDNDDDFNAGFTPEAAPTATPAPNPEATAAAPAAPAAEVVPPKYVQITEDDWNTLQSRAAKVDEISATLDKRFDQVVGTMGRTLERKLAEMQKAAPTGEAVQLDGADFKELAEEFPEVGALTLKGFNNALARFKGTGSDPAAIEKAIAPVRDAMLEIAFPDWKDDVKTPDFAAWRKTQGPDVEALAASDSHADAAKLLRKFYARTKTEATPPAAAPAPVTPPAPAAPSARQRQIAAAVPPKGDGGHPPAAAEDDQFQAGFKYRSG